MFYLSIFIVSKDILTFKLNRDTLTGFQIILHDISISFFAGSDSIVYALFLILLNDVDLNPAISL
jgi:hypothetical protein